MIAIGFGCFVPLTISLFLAVSRYWTENYGYKSSDFTLDTFMLMGFIEIILFILQTVNEGYTLFAISCGLAAATL